MREDEWKKKRIYTPEQLEIAKLALESIKSGMNVRAAIRKHPLANGFLAKHALVSAYRKMVKDGEWDEDPSFLAKIRMKPVRTLSGVTTITALTKPSPCPGECIFCPTELNMPQSYLSDEPGAMRGLENNFDPFRQVSSRIQSLYEVGHPTDKVELLILGGSWSAYSREYQSWFVRRCFDAMNGVNPDDSDPVANLESAHKLNVDGVHRNVGLVVETRPDLITIDELKWYRKLGVTKVQIGIQSLDDHILSLNKRGHTVSQALDALILLRAGGFKVVLHWMPNLLGATIESDKEDFVKLWVENGMDPDELKIYPCQLLKNSELFENWQRGEYHPYSEAELLTLIADLKETIPKYCRVNRVIRDIPSPHIVQGNRNSSLRQDIVREMKKRGTKCQCIRCREVKNELVSLPDLGMNDLTYDAANAEEHFLSFDTKSGGLAGYCRLSLPKGDNVLGIPDLNQAAIIREVHVYGQSIEFGAEKKGAAQHIGLGSSLIKKAVKLSKEKGYLRLAVIAAVGTQGYYTARGFSAGDLYMIKDL